MSIRPIDIQTLLMQLSQVGKDQSADRQASLQASITTAEEQRKRDETKEAIERPDGENLAAEPIKDREGRANAQEGKGEAPAEAQAGPEKEEEKKAAEEVVKDPDLGAHIDLTG
jgi:hypothetical protein